MKAGTLVKVAKTLKAMKTIIRVSLLALAALGIAGLLDQAEPLGGDPKDPGRPDLW